MKLLKRKEREKTLLIAPKKNKLWKLEITDVC
jgi:hypothetical protein